MMDSVISEKLLDLERRITELERYLPHLRQSARSEIAGPSGVRAVMTDNGPQWIIDAPTPQDSQFHVDGEVKNDTG